LNGGNISLEGLGQNVKNSSEIWDLVKLISSDKPLLIGFLSAFMFFHMFMLFKYWKILFLGTVADWSSISLHVALLDALLPIKIHGQVFLW
jgi:hypothetical protein